MKTRSIICAASIAALGGTTFAAHEPGHTSASPQTKKDEDTPMPVRVARYPLRVLHSLFRGPQIFAETVSGERDWVNKHGLFQPNGEHEPTGADARRR